LQTGINAVFVIKPSQLRRAALVAGGVDSISEDEGEGEDSFDSDTSSIPAPPGAFPRGHAVEQGESWTLEDGDTLVFAHHSSREESYKDTDPYLPRPGAQFLFRTIGHC
jgi:hypothetical protein